MTETDNAELAIKRGEQYDVRVTVNAERTFPSSTSSWVEIPGHHGLVAVSHEQLRRPAPRVSEEQIAQAICTQTFRGALLWGEVSENFREEYRARARAVLALFAGETLEPSTPAASEFENIAKAIESIHLHKDEEQPGFQQGLKYAARVVRTIARENANGQPAPAEATPAPEWCPHCNGAGETRVWHGTRGTGHTVYSCDRCNGTGKIVKPAPADAQELEHPLAEAIIAASAGRLSPAQPTVTPDTAGARDWAEWCVGEKYAAPLETRLEEIRMWLSGTTADAANHIITLASQVEALTAERNTAASCLRYYTVKCEQLEADFAKVREQCVSQIEIISELRVLERSFRSVDEQDWDFLLSKLGYGGRERFWRAVFDEVRAYLTGAKP